ncbi:MAG: hypothetical protein NZM25_03070 [Leptospiraceae bacterium]|nr:hypothetical protein [Leptospiraceae bacterium]MDW8307251.1 hypothetical protein [Leptospiraceae bacterium]
MRKTLIWLFLFSSASLIAQTELDEIEKELREAEKRGEEQKSAMGSTPRLVPVRQRTGFIVDRASIPDIFTVADIVHEQDAYGIRRETKNNIDVREVEFGFSGFVDWLAHGNALFALHRDDHQDLQGRYIFDIHELFLDFYNLPYNLRARVGKMFLDAGRLNSIHRHDWFFTNAPLIHKAVMNDLFVGEGAADTGIEIAYLMPWDFFQELKIGIFRGRIFGHGHTDGIEKAAPLWLGRLKQFFPLVGNLGTEFGFTYLRYQPTISPHDVDYTYGSDITFRWFHSRIYRFIFTTEFWYKELYRAPTPIMAGYRDSLWGFYTFFDFIFMQNYGVGYRFDYYEDYYQVYAQRRHYLGNTFWFTYRPSEFAYYRLTLEARHYHGYDGIYGINYLVFLQGTYILGFHLPHRY